MTTEHRIRVADRFVHHGEPTDFRELCRRTVPERTRYLVLDLDRTIHLGRNMGELLGWEVCAYHAYGLERLSEIDARRPPGRFWLDGGRPAALLRYLALGAGMWAAPGLFYLFLGKIPAQFELGRRWMFRLFGTEPVAAIQRIPQFALLHHLTEIPADALRLLAHRVWTRHREDQVIERDDVAWLRERCPGIRVVLASASPQPTLEVAASALGVDDYLSSAVEEHGGWFSAPFQLRSSRFRAPPRRLSGPSQTRINSSHTKVAALHARYPDLADPATISVGMTDTGYGEDHCWTGAFTHVVDVNSPSPFPPLVPTGSPVREIHSAALLTRKERARRARGDARYLDPRRLPREPVHRERTAAELAPVLAPLVEEANRLADHIDERARRLATARDAVARRLDGVRDAIEAIVTAFNAAPERERRDVLGRLERELREDRTLRRELTRIDRPVAEATCALTSVLAESRRQLDASARSAVRAA